jgi:hypothetical protein
VLRGNSAITSPPLNYLCDGYEYIEDEMRDDTS